MTRNLDSLLFDNKVFLLNKKSKISYEQLATTGIVTVDDFYENLPKVKLEIDKLPMSLIDTGSENVSECNLFLDARKCYSQTMKGTELPFLSELPLFLSPFFKTSPQKIEILDKLIINCFSFDECFPRDTYYYNIHTDPVKTGANNQAALVIFLNDRYEKGEGINFYRFIGQETFTKKPLFEKSKVEKFHFIQAMPNRAVMFDSSIPHGQEIGSSQFTEDLRLTQVVFCSIFE
jgi:hypothetical protein